MLYDAAIRHCAAGREAILAEKYDVQNEQLTKAQRIISELMCSLDMEQGGDVAKNLLGLYTYCNNQLVAANIEDRAEAIDPVIRALCELRKAWMQISESKENPVAA
jgi:flagellar protein FliS